jgi:hypothetical protein
VQIAHLGGAGGYDDPKVDEAISVFSAAVAAKDRGLARVFVDISGIWLENLDGACRSDGQAYPRARHRADSPWVEWRGRWQSCATRGMGRVSEASERVITRASSTVTSSTGHEHERRLRQLDLTLPSGAS